MAYLINVQVQKWITGVARVLREALILIATPFLFKHMKNKQNVKKSNFTDEDFLPTLCEQRDDILKNFDFVRVANTMATNIYKDWNTGKYVPWKISLSYGFNVPSADELKVIAKSLMDAAIKCPRATYISRTGPFKVTKVHGRLILDFVVTSWSYD